MAIFAQSKGSSSLVFFPRNS